MNLSLFSLCIVSATQGPVLGQVVFYRYRTTTPDPALAMSD